MNIMEKTPAAISVRIDGMTWEQVRDMIEERFGALMWANGVAYPADSVSISMTFAEPASAIAARSIERKPDRAALAQKEGNPCAAGTKTAGGTQP